MDNLLRLLVYIAVIAGMIMLPAALVMIAEKVPAVERLAEKILERVMV